jgi:phage terminase large subunit-like protein
VSRPPLAWKKYAAGTDGADFEAFCAENLIHWVDDWAGKPFLFEPFERRMFGEALAYDEDGDPIWDSVVIVMPRKNGKTQLLAAYALWRLLSSEGAPEILLTASSDKQADRLFEACAKFVRMNPALIPLCRVRDFSGEILREDGGGKILRMSSDPARLHGYNPSLVVLDELAQWTTPMLERAHAALTSGGGARRAPQTFTISTAGNAATRESSILGRLVDAGAAAEDRDEKPGLTIARLWEAKTLVWNYEAPTENPRDVKAMKLANPASWITLAYLKRQAANPELTDSEVLQLHGCVWAARSNAWLPPGSWRACPTREGWPVDGTDVVLGFDGSYNNDSTALVGCTVEERPYVFVVKVWERPNLKEEWVVPREEVTEEVVAAMERWRVRELVCDPPGWHQEIKEWAERFGSPPLLMQPTNRPSVMAEACSKFYTADVNGDLTHDGNQDLARHLANAVTKETKDGAYITKDGRDSPRKIDLAVAAVIAFDRALAAGSGDYLVDTGALLEDEAGLEYDEFGFVLT